MKRLVLSALFVSVFMIGVSSLIDSASAKFKTDEKAMELIRASRAAIGGGQSLAEVKSMSIKGTTTNFREKAGVQDVQSGSLEINFEIPGRFSKRVMIGEPGVGNSDAIVEKDVEVIAGDGSAMSGAGENVFVIRKGDGNDVNWTSKSDGKISVDGDMVTIRRDDGSVEKIKVDDKNKVVVRTGKGENINIVGEENEDVNVFETDDGKRIVMKGGHGAGAHGNSHEMLRTTMALLMKTPGDGSVDFRFAGKGNVDGLASNVIEVIDVKSDQPAFKLYLDASTNLPQMVSFAPFHHRIHFMKNSEMSEAKKVEMKREMAKPRTHEIRFSDFRDVGGLLLPYRWTESSDGKTLQFVDITEYEINPANIAEKFADEGPGEGKRIIRKRVEKN